MNVIQGITEDVEEEEEVEKQAGFITSMSKKIKKEKKNDHPKFKTKEWILKKKA